VSTVALLGWLLVAPILSAVLALFAVAIYLRGLWWIAQFRARRAVALLREFNAGDLGDAGSGLLLRRACDAAVTASRAHQRAKTASRRFGVRV
jgi:hypothetical protein